jgi:ribosome-binding factor A
MLDVLMCRKSNIVMAATRKQRLQDTLRAELSDIIRRDMRDPRFSTGLLSITDVEVTPDLRHATVFVSVLGNEQARKDELNALRGATGVLRGELGRRKTIINVPELSFKYDDALEHGAHMFELLERIKQEDAARPKPAESEEGEQDGSSE